MKRDWNLIQSILEYMEEYGNGIQKETPQLEGYSQKQVKYHVLLCGEAEYMTVLETEAGDVIGMLRLTWAGHNALEVLRRGKNALVDGQQFGLARFCVHPCNGDVTHHAAEPIPGSKVHAHCMASHVVHRRDPGLVGFHAAGVVQLGPYKLLQPVVMPVPGAQAVKARPAFLRRCCSVPCLLCRFRGGPFCLFGCLFGSLFLRQLARQARYRKQSDKQTDELVHGEPPYGRIERLYHKPLLPTMSRKGA